MKTIREITIKIEVSEQTWEEGDEILEEIDDSLQDGIDAIHSVCQQYFGENENVSFRIVE